MCVCALILIDSLILVEFRRVTKRKKRILSNSSSSQHQDDDDEHKSNRQSKCWAGSPTRTKVGLSRVELAERRLTEMVLVKSGVRIIGHIPHVAKHIPNMGVSACFREGFSILFIISDTVNFFIYYAYNRVFRAYFNSTFAVTNKTANSKLMSAKKKKRYRRNRDIDNQETLHKNSSFCRLNSIKDHQTELVRI